MSEDQKSHIYHLDDRSLLIYYCLPSCEELDNNCRFFPSNSIEVVLSYGGMKTWCHIINKFDYINETGTDEKAYVIMYVKVYVLCLQLFLLSIFITKGQHTYTAFSINIFG